MAEGGSLGARRRVATAVAGASAVTNKGMERDMMSGPQKKALWMASRRAGGARATAAFAIAVVAGLLAGCAQSGATDGRTAWANRDRDSETIKPAGYINPDPAWTQNRRG